MSPLNLLSLFLKCLNPWNFSFCKCLLCYSYFILIFVYIIPFGSINFKIKNKKIVFYILFFYFYFLFIFLLFKYSYLYYLLTTDLTHKWNLINKIYIVFILYSMCNVEYSVRRMVVQFCLFSLFLLCSLIPSCWNVHYKSRMGTVNYENTNVIKD